MSRIRSSFGSYKMRGVAEILGLHRPKASDGMVADAASGSTVLATARPRSGNNGWPMVQLAGVKFLHAVTGKTGNDGKPTAPSKSQSPKPSRPTGGFRNWGKLIIGSVFSLLLAFWSPKWATILKIGGEVETTMKEVEQVAEVVERVATVVEKVSEEVADKLPGDNKIKEAALIVEHVSKEAVKDAHTVEIIHKIDVVKQDMDGVGERLEPIIVEIIQHDKSKPASS